MSSTFIKRWRIADFDVINNSMQIITTHIMADFDALACMVAAKKLYPEAHLVFPGSQEKKVRDYLKESPFSLEFMSLSDVDPDEVSLLIIVDTKLKERIGELAKIVERGKAKIHVYDHHPAHPKDINAHLEHVEEVGAAVTLFVEIFEKKGIPITCEEATLFALGIYEDTGCFTFNSTTTRDLKAMAYLLEKGADLNFVSDYVKRDLTAEQIELLNEMIKNTEIHNIKGIDIAVTTISREKYVGDLAVLAHKLKDMENLNVLFVLARMDDRITFIARSRIEAVDVGSIAAEFGGGGHPTAASAVIKDLTLIQAKDKLLKILRDILIKGLTAKDIMTSPVIYVSSDASISEAEKLMVRFNINSLLVFEDGKLVGIITRQTVEKAIYHSLSNSAVQEFMTADFKTAFLETPLEELEDIMLQQGQRIVPVVDNGEVLGVVTRGELLKALYREMSIKPKSLKGEEVSYPFVKDVKVIMKNRLPKEIWEIIETARKVADELGYGAYLVGGFVRDLLLRVPNLDLDIVIEGDGIKFAYVLAETLGGRVNAHEKFATAVVVLQDGRRIDVATARMEYYPEPAALPEVKMGSIKRDLYRRDFTINAMAIKISQEDAYTLIDFFGGQRDLKDKMIRVMHNLSFVEDPTRAFRAVRFEQRYGFKIGGQTERLIKLAVKKGIINRVSGTRLFSELKYMLSEKEALNMVKRMNELELLQCIHPKLSLTPQIEDLFLRIEEVIAWYSLLFLEEKVESWVLFLSALFSSLKKGEIDAVVKKLCIPKRYATVISQSLTQTPRIIKKLEKAKDAAQVYQILRPFSLETHLFAMAYSQEDQVKRSISLYLTELKKIKPLLCGKDLVALGLEPGPTFSDLLDSVLFAKLRGEVSTKEEEIALVKKLLKRKKKEAST